MPLGVPKEPVAVKLSVTDVPGTTPPPVGDDVVARVGGCFWKEFVNVHEAVTGASVEATTGPAEACPSVNGRTAVQSVPVTDWRVYVLGPDSWIV